MAFVYHDHQGFRPAKRPKKKRGQGPLSVQDLVSRAAEEMTAKGDWLSECRGGFISSSLDESTSPSSKIQV